MRPFTHSDGPGASGAHADGLGGPSAGVAGAVTDAGRRRYRPHALLAVLVAAVAALALIWSATTPTGPGPRGRTEGSGVRAPGRGPSTEPDDRPSATRSDHGAGEQRRAADGDGRFLVAAGDSPVAGTDGPVHRYRVAVEAGTDQNPADFATAVDATLADPRSWTASGDLRVQRVDGSEPADFTVYLATAATSERMCAEGGLHTAGYTSCRLPGKVIINLDRWLTAVPDYAASLDVYRAYVINHEVGHEFGELHEACPGPGRPAPVMQQQTYGLAGCVANAWPYLDGRRYAGDLIP
ncbi:DUF3152 domain-containing protein [Micromonospora sp. NPDC050187]|uniref:DUF3152 domain-containing protein n=1 Tax=Micromonospora sp. NPDC050187 TaxID=3364277 RepID=UPI0037B0919F